MKPQIVFPLLAAGLLALVPLSAQVATSATSLSPSPMNAREAGAIVGRVFNPATGEYVRNAEVRIDNAGIVSSEAGGEFRISPVAPGTHTLVVSYTGYHAASVTVEVAPGATVTQDINLASAGPGSGDPGAPIKLATFSVSSQREGNAKAIMEQRRSMNITNSVSSDLFGNNAEGNLGEFLKYLPGVDTAGSFGEIRNVGLRGLGSEYTSVTLDGMSLASADPTAQSATNSRAFTFENASLSSIESIEISKTVSADVDASAPAGTINLKTKRAFDRAGRRISWQLNAAGHSEEFNLHSSMGPDERSRRKFRPGGIFEYSDVFLNKRLGVVLNISESNLYQEASITTNTYDTTGGAAPLVTQIIINHSPRFNERFSTTLTSDFKATERLVLSLGVIYNYSELWTPQRQAVFLAGNTAASQRTNILAGTTGGDPLVSFATGGPVTAATSALARGSPANVDKKATTFSLFPKFEYKWGDLMVEGKFALSKAYTWYDPMASQTSARNLNNPAIFLNYSAKRSSADSFDWTITQLAGRSGLDLSEGYNTSPAVLVNDLRSGRNNVYTGDVSATVKTNFLLPIVWKAGLKSSYQLYTFGNLMAAYQYNYTPAGGAVASWNSFKSPYALDLAQSGAKIVSLSGGGIFMPDLLSIGRLYAEHPGDFTYTLPVSSYISSYVTSPRRYEETVDAAFLMGTATVGRAMFRAGLRWEGTEGDATDFGQRTTQELVAAGYTVDASGNASTIPGVDYQYFSLPKIHRKSSYDNLFPSGSFKYALTPNLNFQLGYSNTIRRPAFKDVSGVLQVNDTTRIVTAPNLKLQPETSDNFAARLAYYFEPVGILAVNVYENNVKNLQLTNDLTPQQFGYAGPEDLTGYTFRVTSNVPGNTKIRGMEIEYSQSLSFLPGPLQGLGVRLSYTRNYAETVMPGLVPNKVSAGVDYSYRRFSANVNFLWDDNRWSNVEQTLYVRHRSTVDIGASYRLTSRTSAFLTARNLTDTPLINLQTFPDHPEIAAAGRVREIYGTTWTFGIKGTF
jgi:iron complex outermembrane receptor protein